MLLVTHHQLQSACAALDLKRSDMATIFDYNWGHVDKWWNGKAVIPRPVALMVTLWMHPKFPEQLLPVSALPYVLDLPTEVDKYFKRELRLR